MKVTDIIKEIMQLKEVKHTALASRLGIKSNVLSERLTQKNMSINKLSEMLRVLDYKIIIVPRETKLSSNQYEVNPDDYKVRNEQ